MDCSPQRELTSMEKTIKIEHDPNDSWAEVELWRWQYGRLPDGHTMLTLDVSKGLCGMANAIEKGDKENFPSPANVVSVLRYVAKKNKGGE